MSTYVSGTCDNYLHFTLFVISGSVYKFTNLRRIAIFTHRRIFSFTKLGSHMFRFFATGRLFLRNRHSVFFPTCVRQSACIVPAADTGFAEPDAKILSYPEQALCVRKTAIPLLRNRSSVCLQRKFRLLRKAVLRVSTTNPTG